ncbi:hypothetical protein ABZS86_24920 [Streptomyces sp. NPDC005355]|uniref:hypothetical protein n=1 Tax=Streptomyces sp. NPDC005355 TaxID=3157038 RepID=UPI0033A06D2E
METRIRSKSAGARRGVRRAAAVLAVCALGLAGLTGCGADDAKESRADGDSRARGGPSTAATTTSAPPTSASAASAASASDIKECYDGTCEIALTKPTTIDIDNAIGISSISVSRITSDSVTFAASTPSGSHLNSRTGPGGVSVLNAIVIRVKQIKDGTVVLALSLRE